MTGQLKITDGGRSAAGLADAPMDCAARAIAIAAELPYADVLAELNERACLLSDIADRGTPGHAYDSFLRELGWTYTDIGSVLPVHLRAGEVPKLPMGRVIAYLSNHLVAIIDGVIHDTHDPTRGRARRVRGYYRRAWHSPSPNVEAKQSIDDFMAQKAVFRCR